MSRTADTQNTVREQSVYVQSTMDSILEKKGVLKKTKIRCWLHGSTLYEQKDQEVKIHDIRQAQTARKVTNDPTGTQFELLIEKKKHTYVCSSSKECKDWVSALQKCMMLKDSSEVDSNSLFYTEEENASIYSTIDDRGAGPSPSSSPSSESNDTTADKDYYKPNDTVEELVTNHNEYEDVEFRKSSYGIESQGTPDGNCKEEQVYNFYTDSTSEPAHGISEPADGISEFDDENYTYTTVGKKTTNPVDAFAVLETALEDCNFPLDDLPHSLTSEDLSFIRTLKTFLRSNNIYRRSSSLRNSKSEDCLSALKACLSTLNID